MSVAPRGPERHHMCDESVPQGAALGTQQLFQLAAERGKPRDEGALVRHQARGEKPRERPSCGSCVEPRLPEEGEETLTVEEPAGEVQRIEQEESVVLERADEKP